MGNWLLIKNLEFLLVKNIYFYLCYVSLELNDYAGCIRNGSELLKKYKLSTKTEFTTK